MSERSFLDLPQHQRQEITDSVRGAIATFRGPELDGDDLADMVRWTVDAYLRSGPMGRAYDEGFEAGREVGYYDAHAEWNANAKADAGG